MWAYFIFHFFNRVSDVQQANVRSGSVSYKCNLRMFPDGFRQTKIQYWREQAVHLLKCCYNNLIYDSVFTWSLGEWNVLKICCSSSLIWIKWLHLSLLITPTLNLNHYQITEPIQYLKWIVWIFTFRAQCKNMCQYLIINNSISIVCEY